VEVSPPWPFRLPRRLGRDGLARRRGDLIERLMHVEGEPVVVRVAATSVDRVVFGAWADDQAAAATAVERMRFALGVDDDLRPFHGRFRWDPWLGRLLRADPWLRVGRRPDPFEALTLTICEQLIDYPSAAAIERRIVAGLGRRCASTGLRDAPCAATVAGVAPAELEALGLSATRSVALVRAAREVAAGRIDLHDPVPEHGWRRLRAIRGIGPWTVEMLALRGQGRFDQVPAGDLGLLELLGRARSGNPHARADEQEVRELFARYHPYGGLAATYALRAGVAGAEALRSALARQPETPLKSPLKSPDRGGTRWSAPGSAVA
jgi:3-methyladenine DNA glycosylase/8-oxoguanine DNA glycosylase